MQANFKKLLSYEIEYFDLPENNPSVLSARLVSNCEKINSLGGSIFRLVLQLPLSMIAYWISEPRTSEFLRINII